MKAAVLGNGPSRCLYTTPDQYEYVIGCNVPWTNVTANIICDETVVQYWHKNYSNYKHKTFLAERAWREVQRLNFADEMRSLLLDVVDMHEGYDSSAHVAVKKLIDLGYTEIDVYGCDSRFSDDYKSRTNNYIRSKVNSPRELAKTWNKNWDEIIQSNPSVTITFIGESK